MKSTRLFFSVFLCLLFFSFCHTAFHVIPLGTMGGLDEYNLSSFVVASSSSLDEFIACDAGNLLSGLHITQQKGNLEFYVSRNGQETQLTPEAYFLQQFIKSYFISHSHLDHISGLIINSVADIPTKSIIGRQSTIDALETHIFNGNIWANVATTGDNPLNIYNYFVAEFGKTYRVPNVNQMEFRAFPLCHSECFPSTGYLITSTSTQESILYLGDTGSDVTERSECLLNIWNYITPIIINQSLAGIFIECSYDNSRNSSQLFGHLTPSWLTRELHVLYEILQNQTRNENQARELITHLNVVITHIKPSLYAGVNQTQIIQQQLEELNDLQVQYLFPTQGSPMILQWN